MAHLFPFRSSESIDVDGPPRLVNIDDDAANDVIGALSSDTARAILSHLYSDPTNASEVAKAVDTSLQNARYHLKNLQSASLIEPVDTWYSSRGTEMTVYAPTSQALIVAAGREDRTNLLRDAIARVLGALAILAAGSLVVHRAITMLLPDRVLGPSVSQPDAAPIEPGGDVEFAADAPSPDPSWLPFDLPLTDLLATLASPGVAFFLGGMLVIALGAAWWYYTVYSPTYTAR